MNVSPDEAREALAAVDGVRRRTRAAIRLGGGGQIMMVWGAVWFFGYLASQFLEGRAVGLAWGVLDLAGLAGTALVVGWVSRRVHDPMGWRIGLFWLLLFAYAAVWLALARPADGSLIGLLIATMAMFGYVVMGLWIDLRFLWVGLAVTALALAGYLLTPAWFGLWMAFLGGGVLFGSGLYVLRGWR